MDLIGRVLGVDHGTRRTGLALSDPGGSIAQPLEVVAGKEMVSIQRIVEIVTERQVEEVVVGLPVNMDGTLGPQARSVEAFVERLAERLEVPIATWDERLTSLQADQALAPPDPRRRGRRPRLSRSDRHEKRDKIAACLMLQSYLDAGRPHRKPPKKRD